MTFEFCSGSSQANPFACIASGIAALWGPAHGGANEAVLQMLQKIGTKENIPSALARAKDKSKALSKNSILLTLNSETLSRSIFATLAFVRV